MGVEGEEGGGEGPNASVTGTCLNATTTGLVFTRVSRFVTALR